MSRALTSAVVLALPLALTACGGGGNANFTAPALASVGTPTACRPANNATIQLIYPAPAAANVPTNFQNVILASSGALQSSAYTILVPNGSSASLSNYKYGSLTLYQQQALPSGSAISSYASPFYYGSASTGLPPLPSNTLVSVYFADVAQSCTPTLVPSGTFTTQ